MRRKTVEHKIGILKYKRLGQKDPIGQEFSAA